VIAALMAVALSVRGASAGLRCSASGVSCRKDRECCGGRCAGATSGRNRTPGVCVAGSPNGEACSDDAQCASGHCADGVCCATACSGACLACDGGTCAPKGAGEPCDDGLFCTATDVCDGSGSCQGSGSTCPLFSESEVCTVCDESTDSCAESSGLVCGLGAGQACSAWFQCDSSYCIDGVCCESACSGTCEACNAAKTGASDGTCAPLTGLTDPDAECAEGLCLTGLCDGRGFCGAYEAGTDPDDQCPEGPCMTGTCDGAGGCGVTCVP